MEQPQQSPPAPVQQQQQQQVQQPQPTHQAQQQPCAPPQQYQQLPPDFFQQQQQQQYNIPHNSPKGTWITKLSLRSLSAVVSLVIVILAAVNYVRYNYGYAILFLAPPAAVSFVWDVAEAVCIKFRGGHRGIHPGAIVGVDLLLWIAFVILTVLFGFVDVLSSDYYSSYGYGYNYYDDENFGSEYFTINRAIVGLGSVEVLLHLALFIYGCYETSVRNRRPMPIIVYAAPPGPQMFHQGHQSMMMPPQPQAGYNMPAGYQQYSPYYPQTMPAQQNQQPHQQQQQQQPVVDPKGKGKQREYYAPESQSISQQSTETSPHGYYAPQPMTEVQSPTPAHHSNHHQSHAI